MENVLDKLKGGDRRSIGRVDEVIADVLDDPADEKPGMKAIGKVEGIKTLIAPARALPHREERVIIEIGPCSSEWIEQEPPKFKVVRSNRTRGTEQRSGGGLLGWPLLTLWNSKECAKMHSTNSAGELNGPGR